MKTEEFKQWIKKQTTHHCEGDLPYEVHGEAIDACYTLRADGKMWAGNGEYNSQVSFCPFCGAEAPVKPEVKNYEKTESEDA